MRQSSAARATAAKELADPGTGPKIYRGWWLVALLFLTQLISLGLSVSVFSVLLIPYSEALGASRTELSIAPILQFATSALMGIWVGAQLGRRSSRAMMLFGLVTLATGLAALSGMTAVWQLLAIHALLIAFGTVAFSMTANVLLANWFVRFRGRALGIANLGMSLSGAVFVPLTGMLVANFGFRSALLYLLIPLFALAPAIWILVRNRPEDLGLSPDGDPEPDPESQPADSSAADLTLPQLFRSPPMRALLMGLAFVMPGVLFTISYFYPYLIDQGVSMERAALVVAVMTVSAAIAKILFGSLADYYNSRSLLLLTTSLQVAGLIVITMELEAAVTLLGCALFGLGYGGIIPLQIVAISLLAGREALARVLGYAQAIVMPMGLLATFLGNIAWDRLGTYQPVFPALIACYLVALALFYLMRVPSPRAVPADEPA